MHPCLDYESLLTTWVNIYNMGPEIWLTKKEKDAKKKNSERKKQITGIQKYKLQGYINPSYIRETVPSQTSDIGKKTVSVLAHYFLLP